MFQYPIYKNKIKDGEINTIIKCNFSHKSIWHTRILNFREFINNQNTRNYNKNNYSERITKEFWFLKLGIIQCCKIIDIDTNKTIRLDIFYPFNHIQHHYYE